MKRNRYGQDRDARTHKLIVMRSTGGVIVYESQPCRRCGVSIRNRRCACTERRKPMPPSPGRVFAAFVAKAHG